MNKDRSAQPSCAPVSAHLSLLTSGLQSLPSTLPDPRVRAWAGLSKILCSSTRAPAAPVSWRKKLLPVTQSFFCRGSPHPVWGRAEGWDLGWRVGPWAGGLGQASEPPRHP